MFLVNVLPKTLLFDGGMLQQLFSNTFLLTHPKELGNNNQQLHRKSQLKSNTEQNIKLVYLFFLYWHNKTILDMSFREKCPNTDFFLVLFFLYSD